MNLTETLKTCPRCDLGAQTALFSDAARNDYRCHGVMVILSLLQGFSAYVDEKIAGIGSNSFTIRRFNFEDFKDTDTIAAAQRRNKELIFDELDFIREHAQLIDKIGAKAGRHDA